MFRYVYTDLDVLYINKKMYDIFVPSRVANASTLCARRAARQSATLKI